ncbi:hypothetical protein ACLM5J_07585 [Nocardioides sp. Bht2]|uniref:hypothetical protein n=1 Tax=Nocardioides sp. Bht2 TaxID=3392297 RepID=UPI0039B5FA7E
MSKNAPESFPATNGTAIGWLGEALIGVGIIATIADGQHDSDLFVICLLLTAAAGLYAFLLQPHLEINGDNLELHNPFRVVVIPLAAITEMQLRMTLQVAAHEHRYTCAAISRSRRTLRKNAEPDPVNVTQDLIELRVRTRITEAQDQGLPAGPVTQRIVWWLVALVAVPGSAALLVGLLR